ncbi:MAG: lipid-A-disaccharide synthase N-terminal domain-containing protein, partial [Cyclobacteriaceae bacterium]
KEKRSVLPMGFWLISLFGSLMIISYAIYRYDPVLFLGQIFGAILYSRNIILLVRQKRTALTTSQAKE